MRSLLAVVALLATPLAAKAGDLYTVSNYGCHTCAPAVKTVKVEVQKEIQKEIQYVPTFVSFVPSQVSLNGSIATYGVQQPSFNYSYQGQIQQPQNTQQETQVEEGEDVASQILATLQDLKSKVDYLMSGGKAVANSSVGKTEVHVLFSNHCLKCHGANPSDNGFSMFNEEGELLEKLPRKKIFDRVQLPVGEAGHMPKGGPMLPDKSRESVRLWLHDGLEDLEF